MDLYADNVMGESTERMYPESGEAFKDIEITEIIPEDTSIHGLPNHPRPSNRHPHGSTDRLDGWNGYDGESFDVVWNNGDEAGWRNRHKDLPLPDIHLQGRQGSGDLPLSCRWLHR